MDLVWIGVGGFLGAVSRYGLVGIIGKKMPGHFPYGTIVVNLLGSLLLGLLYGVSLNLHLTLLLGTGFVGAFTTFSTFEFEIVQLSRLKKWQTMMNYIGVSVILGILLAEAGYWLGRVVG